MSRRNAKKKSKGGRTGEDMCWSTPEVGEIFKLGKFCTPLEMPNVF